MVDRDTSELRQPDERVLIEVRELGTALLLGEIQAPERLTRNHHRNPKKALHRGMPRGKAIGQRVPSDIRQTQRHWITDQLAEHAMPRRRRPNNPTARRLIRPGTHQGHRGDRSA
jgi:hypothetical protein